MLFLLQVDDLGFELDEISHVLTVVLDVILHFCMFREQLSSLWPREV